MCIVVVVVIQFLSGIFSLAQTARFTPFLLQLLAPISPLCTLLDLRHLLSSNQSSLSPLLLASSRSFSVVLAFPCHSLQDQEQVQNTIVILLSTCGYHQTPFAAANRSIVSFNPNMSICSSVVFVTTTFRPHVALIIALSVLLKNCFFILF